MLKGESIQSAPDLRLHTLIHFLDRFVYRNAKKKAGNKGSSIMQPIADQTGPDVVVSLQRGAGGLKEATVNSEAFWRRKVEDVPVDELFFHKYFNQKMAGVSTKANKKKQQKAAEEEESDHEEDEVWRAMVNSMPGEGPGAGDDDDEDVDEDDSEDDEEMQALLMDSEDDEIDDDEEDEGSQVELGDQDFDDMDDWEDDEEQDSDSHKRKADDDVDDEPEQEEEEQGGAKKKRTKKPKLPTFASFEDYAAMLDD